MEFTLEILKITLPSLFVFFAGYFAIKAVFKKDIDKRKLEIVLDNKKIVTPIRLKAYERVILFLERISPESLIIRIRVEGTTNAQLHQALLEAVRQEFEHNLSQQLYLSDKAWSVCLNSKENIIKLINTSFFNLDPKGSSIQLSKNIIEAKLNNDINIIESAISLIKKEISTIF